jgi:branched-chain amino acid transport system permease protein
LDIIQSIVTALVYGVLAGGTYSLIALGLSMIFGVANLIDFTYVAYIALSGYLLYSLDPIVGPGLGILIAILVIIPMAIVVERFFIRPLRNNANQVMMVTFGIALFAQYLIIDIWGSLTVAVPPFLSGAVSILGNVTSLQSFFILPVSIAVSIVTILFVDYTRRGRSIVAVSQDADAAWLMGVNVSSTMALTIVLGAVLAATASLISAPTIGLTPGAGWSPFVTAFVVVVLGGLGSIKASVVASYIYGIILNFGNVFLSPQWADTIGFLILIIILLVRPEGVLGRRVTR